MNATMPSNRLKSHDFAALAKRISAWTTNSLLTLIVLVAGLGFGRQTLKWWAADASPSSVVALPTDSPDNLAQLHTLQFGDNSWSLRRRLVAGDKNKAVEQLRTACREVLVTGASADKPPTGEDRFLAFLAGSTPVDQEPGKWRLYELQETFPMTVGVARPWTPPPEPVKPNLVQSGYRVAVWGLALPAGDKQWMLSTFQSEAPSTGGRSGLSDVPVPPEGRRMLSLSAASGRIIALSGPDRPGEWRTFYDDWFARQGCRSVAGWQPTGPAWYAKFAAHGDSVDIRFGPDGRGGLSGLLMMTPNESRRR